jgi:hypothetical protein
MQERTSARSAGKFPRSSKKKNRQQNGSAPNGKFAKMSRDRNRDRDGQTRDLNSGVCQKCGQPAPDGKLCSFHRALLNTIRNEPVRDRQRTRQGFRPF